jgi:hypothetical protein
MTGWLTWGRKGGSMITEEIDQSGPFRGSGDEHKPSGGYRRAFVLEIGSCHRKPVKQGMTRRDG